jgi:hypothetical protein
MPIAVEPTGARDGRCRWTNLAIQSTLLPIATNKEAEMSKYHMINSLTLDLLETSLEDFAEHFERLMERKPRTIVNDLPQLSMGQYDDIAVDDLPANTQQLLRMKAMTIVHISRSTYGTTGRGYSISAFESEVIYLAVDRFRRDRLRLIYSEPMASLRYARPFIEWLTPRFGDPIYHVNLDLKAILREPPT